MTAAEHVPARRRVVLTGISSRAWEHPADRGALTALRELKGFDEVLKALSSVWSERAYRLEFLGSAIRVDHRQFPRIHRLFAESAATLDLAELPELYVQYDRTLNGMCVGLSKPFIVVNSGALELLDDEELRHLLGHELGHLMSGHAVYRTMLAVLTSWAVSLAWLPLGSVAIRAIIMALREWWRKAELSADRAGLLAGQDPNAALRLSMKLAGGGNLSEVDTTAFLEQAAEYDRVGDLRESLIKLRMVAGRTHPLPVARAAALRQWIDSGEYGRVLAGEYPRRADDATASPGADVKAAAESYRQAFADSQDPLTTLVRRLGDGAAGLGDLLGSGAGWMRGWMRGGQSAGGASSGGTSSSGRTSSSGGTASPGDPPAPDEEPPRSAGA